MQAYTLYNRNGRCDNIKYGFKSHRPNKNNYVSVVLTGLKLSAVNREDVSSNLTGHANGLVAQRQSTRLLSEGSRYRNSPNPQVG